MNAELVREYRKFRQAGWDARAALRRARVLLDWGGYDDAGLVRFTIQPEEENYFSVYGTPDDPREKESIERAIDCYGVWYIRSDYRLDSDSAWEYGDGIGMCIYDDPLSPYENEYVVDMMQETIKEISLYRD